MPEDQVTRETVTNMIEAFHRREVMPLYRETLSGLAEVKSVLTDLVTRTDERKKTQDETKRENDAAKEIQGRIDAKKLNNQTLTLKLLAVVISLLGLLLAYVGTEKVLHPQAPTAIGSDKSIQSN